jgi:ribosomal protein S18 acetylase RimI-like enzyme
MTDLSCERPQTVADALQTANYLADAGATFGGSRDVRCLEWLCRLALADDPNVLLVTARSADQIVGCVIAVRREPWLACRLTLRTPGVGLLVLLRLFLVGIRSVLSGRPPKWTTSYGSRAAKVLLVMTSAEARGRGVGRRLYAAIYRLAQNMADIDWVIARVEADNVSSVALHRAAGWTIRRESSCLFCFTTVIHAP